MTDNVVGKKISEMIQQTTAESDDLYTFVRSQTNYSIKFSGILNSLGVTGSIDPVGDASGTPVLEQPIATVNNIRNINSGVGTIISLTPSNGIDVSCDFVNGSPGSNIIKDITADQLLFRSLSAGSGINIAESGDSIQITAVAAAATSKTVVIAQESDFPAPASGVITLADGTDYLLTQDVVTSNRFAAHDGVIRASDSSVVKLTYTGSGTMFTGVNKNFKMTKLKAACPNGTLFNMTGGVFQMDDMTVSECDVIGSLNALNAVQIGNTDFSDIKTNGMTFSGNTSIFIMERNLFNQNGGTTINLGVATFDGITAVTTFATLAAGTVFLDGATNSANINTNGLGTLVNARISGSGTTLVDISPNDIRWNFTSNDDIPDTRPDGLLSFQTPTTTVLAIATPALITGPWVVQRVSQMTGTVAGRITYNAEKAAILPISATLSVEPVSGTNKAVKIYFAKNGSVIAASAVNTVVSSGSPKNQTVNWQDSFSKNDYYEVFIESVDGTNLRVNTANLRVN